MSAHELAQPDVAVMKEPLDSPAMADLVANLDPINALAGAAPGFVWRLQTADGDATAVRPLGEDTLVNRSVWRDVGSLGRYAYGSAHAGILRRRQECFDRMKEAHVVLGWVPRGHRPDIAEAVARLETLRTQGPTAEAFPFRQAFSPPRRPGEGEQTIRGTRRRLDIARDSTGRRIRCRHGKPSP